MATEQRTVCDVYGTAKDVKLTNIAINGEVCWSPDLSPRGRERLRKFIDRALTPPGRKIPLDTTRARAYGGGRDEDDDTNITNGGAVGFPPAYEPSRSSSSQPGGA